MPLALSMGGVEPNNPIDRSKAQLKPLELRPTKAQGDDFAQKLGVNPSLQEFLQSLPDIFKGSEIKKAVTLMAEARRLNKPVLAGMGAHVIKTGMAPLLIEALEENSLGGIAVHGAACVHDLEIALIGRTSEDVQAGLNDGSFGMVKETGQHFFDALAAYSEGGLGYRLGRYITEQKMPFAHLSLFAACYRLQKPITVHVAVGTDIVHQHPAADGRLLGELSYYDFETLAGNLPAIDDGGGFINFGSAVIVPEVFLKALTLARNIQKKPYNFFTLNFDQIYHYRPRVNIVERPTDGSTRPGLALTGHHEIMIPLFLHSVRAAIKKDS